MKKLNKSEAINQILKIDKIQWKFNLSRVPWWGGKFEQVVGPVKNPLYKTVGKVFFIVERIRRSIVWHSRCLKQPTFKLY